MPAPLPALLLLLSALGCRTDDPLGGDTGAAGDTGDGSDLPTTVAELGLVPLPAQISLVEGSVRLTDDSRVIAAGDAAAVAALLAASLRVSTGLALPVVDDAAAPGDIALLLTPGAGLAAEAYTLDVVDQRVQVQASDAAGLFYGAQTLRQLLPPEAVSPSLQAGVDWVIPGVQIADAPAYSWRGGMLDVARHFFDSDVVKRQVDLYALHKLNRLHLHLTDDQGWRIEIMSWPDLALIGGQTEVGGGPGGYYTQAEFAELVAYAAERHVQIVPEIDFPGHAHAALASYGELNESGKPAEPYTGKWVITTPLWLDGEATWQMVEDVWTEVAALTPGDDVHVGGDEAIDLSVDDYSVFMVWLQEVVAAQGKTLVGWDEIGLADLSPPYLTQYWWSTSQATAAADNGSDLIYSYASDCYLDMMYDSSGAYGQTWAGYVDVQTAYGCDPDLAGSLAGSFIGVEAPLWTEFVETEDQVDFMTWPRLSAVAEVGWTPADDRGWTDFRDRLGRHGARLDALGVAYNPSAEIDWAP